MQATGYNVIDIEAAREYGITVTNIPAYSTASVAQMVMAHLLNITQRVDYYAQQNRAGRWGDNPDFCYWDTPQMELAGKTMGIIGFGRIGQAVGRIAIAMGMKVLAYSRSIRPEGEEIATYVDLDTLLSQSDIVSLHCPLFPETQNLINTDTIAKMKDGAILLNTSRGPVIDEAAVADALKRGILRGAAMDVVSEEPIRAENPLLSAPNCIITPHMAWAPMETRQRILDITVQNISGFITGDPVNVVNS